MFNHDNYVNWFQCLLDQIDDMGKTGVIIALDNASYHKGLPDDTFKGTWSKARLVEACELFGIAASISDYKTQI
ncbi:hypothetical protein ACHHYP_15010 [Achlya hypogyna]|uniref:Tc1-like transposase DDE domain-containing protein n=1 Tax=Achlya hypogyna TaxID=1202772 RepID=A0A1V9YBW0_ACHHY|nr:hypothetical protein ACHHYP_15010 [Achlya hypogyna]